MSVVRCPKGHFYDDQRFSHCPHCGIFSESSGNGAGSGAGKENQNTVGEKKKGLFGWLDREKTVAFNAGKTEAADEGRMAAFGAGKAAVMDEGKTVAFDAKEKNLSGENSGEDHTIALKNICDDGADDQKTIGFFSGAKGNDFVTGWLVCVEGEEKGRDYRLHHGFNRVGRSFGMDVQVMEDPAISKEGHCSIVYDDKTNQFSLIPSNGSITYFKGQMLNEPKVLHTGDELRIGNSRFVFIPFCGEGRVWEKEEK